MPIDKAESLPRISLQRGDRGIRSGSDLIWIRSSLRRGRGVSATPGTFRFHTGEQHNRLRTLAPSHEGSRSHG